jgi:hypothetical protein
MTRLPATPRMMPLPSIRLTFGSVWCETGAIVDGLDLEFPSSMWMQRQRKQLRQDCFFGAPWISHDAPVSQWCCWLEPVSSSFYDWRLEECLASLDWRSLLEGPRTWRAPMTVDWSNKMAMMSLQQQTQQHTLFYYIYLLLQCKIGNDSGARKAGGWCWRLEWRRCSNYVVAVDEMSEILVMSTQWAECAMSTPCALGNRSFHVC